MKSITIRQGDQIIFHIKRTKKGVTGKVLNGVKVKIKIILDDNSIINL